MTFNHQGSSEFIEYADSAPESSHFENTGESSHVEDARMEDEMVDHLAQHHVTEPDSEPHPPPVRRRSTIMFEEEGHEETHEEGPYSRAQEGDQVDLTHNVVKRDVLIETVIEWKQGGQNVFVTGSFTGWKQMIPLRKIEDGTFVVVLKLPPMTHRLRFVVDGELRCSDDMNTATDSMGNLVNYLEVSAEQNICGDDQDDTVEPQPVLEYTRQIPEIFADPDALDRFSSIEFTPPPQLPPHLDGVILNTNSSEKDNNSVLPIPNHVVLNHLATTSIKHNVLAVASVSRYRAKYITQILYSPLQGM